jgi:hypothetical protein
VDISGNPAFAEVLARMREAMDAWLERVNDLSDMPESEMIELFYPDGSRPQTLAPEVSFNGNRLVAEPATAGSSIGYSVDGGHWQLYSGPVEISSADTVEVKAVRYGWKTSEVVELAP